MHHNCKHKGLGSRGGGLGVGGGGLGVYKALLLYIHVNTIILYKFYDAPFTRS